METLCCRPFLRWGLANVPCLDQAFDGQRIIRDPMDAETAHGGMNSVMSAVQSGQEDFSGMLAYKLNQVIPGTRHHLPHCLVRDQAEHHALREKRFPGECARFACLLKPRDELPSGGAVSLGWKDLRLYEIHDDHGKRSDE